MSDAAAVVAPWLFNAQTAREAAAKSVASRKRQAEADAKAAEQSLKSEVEAQAAKIAIAKFPPPQIERLHAEMEAIIGLMEATADPKQKDAFSRAYDRLFKAWQVLSATPGPGQRKPATIRGRNNPAGPGGFHVPAEPSNCGPDAPSGGVPAENSVSQTPQGTNPQ